MKRIKNILICGLALSFFIVGCGQDQEPSTTGLVSEEKGITDEGTKVIEQAKEESEEEHPKSEHPKAEGITTKGSEMLEQVKSKAESMKDKTASIIKDLIAKAKAFFEQGEYEKAITTSQDVLNNYDSDSQEAKGIITQAKEKLKELVTEKAKEGLGTTDTEKVEDLEGGVMDKLKSFGK